MNLDYTLKWIDYIISLFIFIFGFLLFYSETNEWKGSLLAAILSAALTFVSLVAIRWLIEVFTKKQQLLLITNNTNGPIRAHLTIY